MNHAKMLVLSSQVEGFGNVIVEAMAVGCPVIATDCGGPNDSIKHNINGLIVDSTSATIAQAIQQLIDNSELRNRLSSQAQQDVKRFSPELSCARFNSMLVSLLNSTIAVSGEDELT
jgi:glycosyltransferase involved in cell wall biosynthesis